MVVLAHLAPFALFSISMSFFGLQIGIGDHRALRKVKLCAKNVSMCPRSKGDSGMPTHARHDCAVPFKDFSLASNCFSANLKQQVII
jgi:hypothetical protein